MRELITKELQGWKDSFAKDGIVYNTDDDSKSYLPKS